MRERPPNGGGTVIAARATVTPETRYAKAGEVFLAYQAMGSGGVDLVLADRRRTDG